MRRRITILSSKPTEKIIEKSRFITYSNRIESEEEAKAFLAGLKEKHPFASHVCYAYIADSQGNLQRFSDNGEPQGTAGMPILENLKVRDLVYSIVAVVRYFGGIKLGAGGLTRAYSACAKENLECAELCEILPCEEWRIYVDYPSAEGVKKFLNKREMPITSVEYAERAVFTLRVQSAEAEELRGELNNFLCGKAEICVVGASDGYFPL